MVAMALKHPRRPSSDQRKSRTGQHFSPPWERTALVARGLQMRLDRYRPVPAYTVECCPVRDFGFEYRDAHPVMSTHHVENGCKRWWRRFGAGYALGLWRQRPGFPVRSHLVGIDSTGVRDAVRGPSDLRKSVRHRTNPSIVFKQSAKVCLPYTVNKRDRVKSAMPQARRRLSVAT